MKQVVMALCLMLAYSTVQASEFLPVDEAFRLNVQVEDEQLRLDWSVADAYYLYRDNHQLRGHDGAAFGPAELSDNDIIKYDPTFDEDMAVYYHSMSAEYPVLAREGYFEVVYQGCADAGLCYPPQKRYFDAVSGEPIAPPTTQSATFSSNGAGQALDLDSFLSSGNNAVPTGGDGPSLTLLLALGFALLGGLVLNLMPCVFPVLSIKALHLAQLGHHASEARLHGWLYTSGVVLSFLAVAVVMLLLRQFGDWVGWGFQLQSPVFVAILIGLFFVMALWMAGYVEFGQKLMGLGQDLTQKPGHGASFFTGALATLVATPCTAPFMGAAIGFALLQPAAIGLLIFAVMGLGMAAPILVLSHWPGLARALPKPGAWMNHFRQAMAFLLFATVLWLVWVLVELQGTAALLKAGLALILVAVALWPALTLQKRNAAALKATKLAVRLGALVVAVVLLVDQRPTADLWQPYSDARLSDYRAQGEPVFLNVTAAWCITCKANERVALSGSGFERLVSEQGIQLLRADWTNPSPEVDALIAGHQRDGIPLYAFYPAGGGEPRLLPQLLTPGLVEDVFTTW
ncbi:MAG: protein-disulfide reductase DsbD family protein [Saccharospirillum sp.]